MATPRSSPLLQVRDLRTEFHMRAGTARAVDGVSFRVDPGETVGIVGESGCGKTVTALSLLGLVPDPPGRILPSSSVRFRGEELVGAPASRLRRLRGREMAMVFQEPMTSLNPVMTVGSQIAEVLGTHLGVKGRAGRERVVSLLGEVGIPDPEARRRSYPHELSGGMRQRVMIAMALACEPALLVADEPTSALDVTTEARILSLLAELRARHGMAMLLVSHDLAVVARVCHRVMVMYAGQIVETGTMEAVFRDAAHPYTRALVSLIPRVSLRRRGSMPPTGGPGHVEEPRGPRPIPGMVPPATAWPTACRFADRCPHAWERCRTEPPPLLRTRGAPAGGEADDPDHGPPTVTSPDQYARCWLVEEPHRRRARGVRDRADA